MACFESISEAITRRIPCTNSMPIMISVKAPNTGFGTASSSAASLGRNASTASSAPAYTPARRAATPVISTTATLEE